MLSNTKKTRYLNAPATKLRYLFRSLFPSWQFFAAVTEVPVLYLRISQDGQNFSPWENALKKPARHWYSLFLNPEGNLFLACNSLLQQAEVEIGDLSPIEAENYESSVSFNLIKNLVQFCLRQSENNYSHFQFKIGRVLQGSDLQAPEDFLISIIYQSADA